MRNQSLRQVTTVVAGVFALFAFVQTQAQGVDPGPYAEQVLVDVGANETIECIAFGPGYIYLDGNDGDGQETISGQSGSTSPYVLEPPAFGVYAFPQGGLPIQVGMAYFDETALNLNGSAVAEVTPFPAPIPQEQLAVLNTDTGAPAALLLENTWGGADVNIDCAIYSLVDDQYYTNGVGQTVKKKALKKRIANANKRKVHKAAAKKKAAAKRKKAAPKKVAY